MAGDLVDELRSRLIDNGWIFVRASGGHSLYEYPPNGQRIGIPLTVKNTGRRKQNYLASIERAERAQPGEYQPGAKVTQLPGDKKVALPKTVLSVIAGDIKPRRPKEDKPRDFKLLRKIFPWNKMLEGARQALHFDRAVICNKLEWTATRLKQMESGKLDSISLIEALKIALTYKIPIDLFIEALRDGYFPIKFSPIQKAGCIDTIQNLLERDPVVTAMYPGFELLVDCFESLTPNMTNEADAALSEVKKPTTFKAKKRVIKKEDPQMSTKAPAAPDITAVKVDADRRLIAERVLKIVSNKRITTEELARLVDNFENEFVKILLEG